MTITIEIEKTVFSYSKRQGDILRNQERFHQKLGTLAGSCKHGRGSQEA